VRLKRLSSEEYQSAVGLLPGGGPGLLAAVADHWRWAVWRHGPCAQASITRQIQSRLDAAGVERTAAKEATAEALSELLRVGDIAKVQSSHGTYLVPVEPVLVRLGDETSALIGSLPTRLARCDLCRLGSSVTRFFSPEDAEVVVALQRAGAVEWPLRALVGRPGLLARKWTGMVGRPASLGDAWLALTAELGQDALPVSAPERLRIVAGNPGGYLGRPDEGSGRWEAPVSDGVWVGIRPGQGEAHLIPILAFVQDGGVRSVDLADREEFRWALIARGASLDMREVARTEPGVETEIIQCSFEPPKQVRRLLAVCGAQTGTWRWEVHRDALDAVEQILSDLGVMLLR
jgi:hypothetical protein